MSSNSDRGRLGRAHASIGATPAPTARTSAAGPPADGQALATFGGGCFWCTEAVFEETEGVALGRVGLRRRLRPLNPTYQAVCSGTTGHAEVIQVAYDPTVISYKELLEIFFRTHDPTTLNRQGADVGTQYRSVIYYHDKEQQAVAEEVKAALDASGAFSGSIVTEISAARHVLCRRGVPPGLLCKRNPNQGYCRAVIAPEDGRSTAAAFADRLKSE